MTTTEIVFVFVLLLVLFKAFSQVTGGPDLLSLSLQKLGEASGILHSLIGR